MKKVLIIDDSALMRRGVSDIIERTSEYEVGYVAKNGLEGLYYIQNYRNIDAVLCDLNMPLMTGIEMLRKINELSIDVPVIILSSSDDSADTITALELGAIDFIKKPERGIMRTNAEFRGALMNALELAVKAKKSKPSKASNVSKNKSDVVSCNKKAKVSHGGSKKLVALACSTGGPKALQYVLPKLPANLDAAVVLVQHMPVGFTESLAKRLDDLCDIKVKEAADNELIQKGVVYIARGGTHITVIDKNGSLYTKFDDSPPVVGLKPCANIMYESLQNISYDEIVCVVLTGMGADGTKGIQALSKCKHIHVIAQNQESSTVYGMPRAVYESGLVDVVCDINKIAEEIVKKVGVQ